MTITDKTSRLQACSLYRVWLLSIFVMFFKLRAKWICFWTHLHAQTTGIFKSIINFLLKFASKLLHFLLNLLKSELYYLHHLIWTLFENVHTCNWECVKWQVKAELQHTIYACGKCMRFPSQLGQTKVILKPR